MNCMIPTVYCRYSQLLFFSSFKVKKSSTLKFLNFELILQIYSFIEIIEMAKLTNSQILLFLIDSLKYLIKNLFDE